MQYLRNDEAIDSFKIENEMIKNLKILRWSKIDYNLVVTGLNDKIHIMSDNLYTVEQTNVYENYCCTNFHALYYIVYIYLFPHIWIFKTRNETLPLIKFYLLNPFRFWNLR